MQVLGSTRKHLSLHRFPVFLIFDLACLFSFWTLGISWTAFYEITLVRLYIRSSVYPSVRPSVTKFSQDWIISFFWYAHYDSWPWYLVTDKARLKKKWRPQFGPNRLNSAPKLGFLPLAQVWFISFPWYCIQW